MDTMDMAPDIVFELTLRCNMNCRMCSRQFLEDKTSQMDLSTVRNVCTDLERNAQDRNFNFSIGGYGEPLLYPGLEEAIRLIKGSFPYSRLTLTTNGQLLDRDTALMLIDSGLDYLRVSLNATNAEEYRYLMRSPNFAAVEENLAGFLALKLQWAPQMKVGIQILETKVNEELYPSYKQKWLKLLSGEDFIAYRHMENRGGVIDSCKISGDIGPMPASDRNPCYALWRYLAIDTRRNVYCCCEAYTFREQPTLLCLGNLGSRSITEIMNSPELARVRRMHLEGDYSRLPECRACNKTINYPNLWTHKDGKWEANHELPHC